VYLAEPQLYIAYVGRIIGEVALDNSIERGRKASLAAYMMRCSGAQDRRGRHDNVVGYVLIRTSVVTSVVVCCTSNLPTNNKQRQKREVAY
jgi:hypothetical protein